MAKSKSTVDPSEPVKDGSEKDYQAESAFRTIAEAHGHLADPEMMRRVSKVADRQASTAKKIKRISDIRDASRDQFPPDLKFEAKKK